VDRGGKEVIAKDQWIEVVEISRAYTFPNGEKVVFWDVRRMRVSPNGTHFLETGNGMKHILAKTWLYITVVGQWIEGHR
jgi:hypothetical protein